jgi:hypothetical protein
MPVMNRSAACSDAPSAASAVQHESPTMVSWHRASEHPVVGVLPVTATSSNRSSSTSPSEGPRQRARRRCWRALFLGWHPRIRFWNGTTRRRNVMFPARSPRLSARSGITTDRIEFFVKIRWLSNVIGAATSRYRDEFAHRSSVWLIFTHRRSHRPGACSQ